MLRQQSTLTPMLRQQTTLQHAKTKNLAAYANYNWILKKQATPAQSEYDSLLDNQSVNYKN